MTSNSAKKKTIRGTAKDVECRYATALDPKLEQWRALAAEWIATVKSAKKTAMQAMANFLVDYIHRQSLETDPAKFLRKGNSIPCFYESCLSHIKERKEIQRRHKKVNEFLDYVLENYFSVDDDDGNRVVSPAFCNSFPPLPGAVDSNHAGGNRDESNKLVLPHYFITRLRHLLCPLYAKNFTDWTWSQSAEDTNSGGGWFVVPLELIDKTDPDCVWRSRVTSQHEQKKFGYSKSVYEMWSPVRAVALYLKLQLPLRTYQVRMLDSGEADTHRYAKGEWVRNASPLAKGNDRNPYQRGVFRQMTDEIKHRRMTGLFINTNKTADKGKDEWSKGYSIPWEHPEVLYWLEKLRNCEHEQRS